MNSASRWTLPLAAPWLLALGAPAVAASDEDMPAPAPVVITIPAPAPVVVTIPAPESPASDPPAPEAPASEAAPGPPVRELEPGAPALANQRYRAGIEMYTRADFSGAAREFKVAQALAPRSAKLAYNLARSLERAGDVPGAISAYRQYLALSPEAADRAAILQVIGVLERERRAASPPPAPASTGVSAAAPAPKPADLSGREIALWSTVAGAGIAAVVGTIFALRAADTRTEADGLSAGDTTRHASLQDDFESAQLGTTLGFGLTAALGLAAGTLALWPVLTDADTGHAAAGRPALGLSGLGFSF